VLHDLHQCSQDQVPASRIAHLTCHRTSTVLRLNSGSVLLFPLFFAIFPLFPLFFAVFPLFPLLIYILLLGSSVFPLLSLFLCLVPLFPSIFSIYFSQLYQQPTDPTYELGYVPRVYVLSPADRSCVGSRYLLH